MTVAALYVDKLGPYPKLLGPEETLGDALPKEMARVRDELMPRYIEIGPAGALALMMMRSALDRAAVAMAAGDTVAMIRVYQELKDFTE